MVVCYYLKTIILKEVIDKVFDRNNIPEPIIRELARKYGVKCRTRVIDEILLDLVDKGATENLHYLNKEFRYASSTRALTICKPEWHFPKKSQTAEEFMKTLHKEKGISTDLFGTEWNPELEPFIQICGLEVDGSDVYIKMVKEVQKVQKQGYNSVMVSQAYFTSAVIHFADQVIELRCAYTYRNEYAAYIMSILGFPQPYKWIPITSVTKDQAKQISNILSAGLVSTQVAIPSSVGSLRFNGKKGIDLRIDNTFSEMKIAIESIGLPTDDTLDEVCFFNFIDPRTQIMIPVHFEINLSNGGFKFLKRVTEKIIETVLDAFIQVRYLQKSAVI